MCIKVSILLRGLILQCLIFEYLMVHAITLQKSNEAAVEWTVHGMGRSLAGCFADSEKLKCVEVQIARALDKAIQDNSTWHYGNFLAIEKANATGGNGTSYLQLLHTAATAQGRQPRQRSFGDTIGEKVLQLAEGRAVRLQLPQPQTSVHFGHLDAGISDGLDNIAAAAEEGRKKKDKDKNIAALGGLAVMAMVAQLFFGKVLLIAGAAFVMAKIALVVALLGSLKKGSGGSSGSTDHVIVTSGGGGGSSGHSHESGWHRSMPHDEYPPLHVYSAGHQSDEPSPPVEEFSSAGPPSHSASHGGLVHKPSSHNHDIIESEDEHDFKRRHVSGFL